MQRCQPFQFLQSRTDFQVEFSITNSEIKIMANNFKTVLDKIKEVTPTCTLMWRKLFLFTSYKIGLFLFKNQTHLCVFYWKNITVAGKKLQV